VRATLHGSGAPSAWRATLSGLSATLVGIGLARFAYTPLMPALIAARWFDLIVARGKSGTGRAPARSS
jgi:hypothetical protein